MSSFQKMLVHGMASVHEKLVRRTPLIRSPRLSKLCERDVYLKLDLLQPSGSFKDRGMAELMTDLIKRNVTQVFSSSGGNAGLAAATVGQQLDLDVNVLVPTTTKPMVVAKLQALGANVTVVGKNWNEADAVTRQLVEEAGASAAYISPYDNVLLWKGHSSVITEIQEQLPQSIQRPPAAVLCSVGGGGLLCGILQGLASCYQSPSTVVVAAETTGTASFHEARKAGQVVSLDGIHSVATSLGALSVTPETLVRSAAHEEGGGLVVSTVVTDREAVDACLEFAQDHRMLVEPACGAALAVLYSPRLLKPFLESLQGKEEAAPIVVQVCGGSAVNLDLLQQWRTEVE